ncbi:glycosyltransferase [Leptolyngbya sp. FACHB-321]|uniref:glycosyltransferase family 2 protein n=1 Tax=Leptolyngbya sp. FACHB-321 TaxID=2692807 RepID=UPI0016827FEB|nr:glycosyltransferase [Leptolyngbya sp. FACHB-321]MBD2036603.1 glycosyltransferase [Leptolyngbya sp. FACHB-321]
MSIKLIDIELSHPLQTIENLTGFQKLKALVRWHGVPFGFVQLPVHDGRCLATTIAHEILEKYRWSILHQALQVQLSYDVATTELSLSKLLNLQLPSYSTSLPSVTVAICTHDHLTDLRRCLDALSHLNYPNVDYMVVDYAPSDNTTAELIRTKYPHIHYVHESHPSLNWARNRAALEAKGEIIAYVDDRSVADSEWVKTLATRFAESPEVMVVTGLVVPEALDTDSQYRFENYGGFALGCERKWFHTGQGKPLPRDLVAHPWWMGTDLNMAVRRTVFEQIGYFDPSLTMNSSLNGAGALDLFCRVLKHGHVLVYEPAAIVRHQVVTDNASLQAHYRRVGSRTVYLLHNAMLYRDERKTALSIGLWWTRTRIVGQFAAAVLGRSWLSRDLAFAEVSGSIASILGYGSARKAAAKIEQEITNPAPHLQSSYVRMQEEQGDRQHRTAVRTVELTLPVEALTDTVDYDRTRVIVTWQGAGIGQIYVWNHQQIISAPRLRDAIISELGYRLFDPDQKLGEADYWARLQLPLAQRFMPERSKLLLDTAVLRPTIIDQAISASIVICTCDRPDDLRNCLRGVTKQDTDCSFEIIVVDNRPQSDLTASIVAEFPQVKLMIESRPGADYARNTGIAASRGEIVVMLDDDTTVPPAWLENLLTPFDRPEVMAVTGNILPVELESASQRLFESYGDGGLGRGFERFEGGSDWFSSKEVVRTWLLGGTANIACRACLFADPQIGLLDEALGAGMPSGSGEDIYFFYKILKAGYTIAYEPTAFVWHKHRQDMPALRRQLYNYSKGHVAYHLTLILEEQDWRSLKHLLVTLPQWHAGRIIHKLKGQSRYPISLVILEVLGHLAGAWSLWASHRRVQQLGYSQPYIPLTERLSTVSFTEGASTEIVANETVAETNTIAV